jgi:hypothetical protein
MGFHIAPAPRQYDINLPQAPPASQQNDDFLSSLGSGLGQGFGQGIHSAVKSQIQQSVLDRALKNIPESIPIDQQLQQYARLDPQTQGALRPLLEHRISQAQAQQKQMNAPAPTLRQEVDKERLYHQLTQKYAPEDQQKQQELLKFGNMFMEQGATPISAFNQSQKLVKKREKVFQSLDKIPDLNSGWFGKSKVGENQIKQIKAKVYNARKSGVMSDDDIGMTLLKKNYTPEVLEKLGLDLSDDFMSNLSNELENEEQGAAELNDIDALAAQASKRQRQSTQQAPVSSQTRQEPEGMPNAASNVGKKLRDNATGQVFVSDGKNWIPQ